MIHLGDITKINGAEIEPVDCMTYGSPCQDLSVAGKREGLAGERSGLFMEVIRIIKEMRHAEQMRGRTDDAIRPRYGILENVPGLLSSNGGEDFRCVLEETARIIQEDANIPGSPKGGWPYAGSIILERGSIAWKIHDAQWWGVPQRRKRICVLADFNGWSAADILFAPEYRRTAERTESYSAVGSPGRECRSEIQSVSQGLSGDTEQGEQARQEAAGDTSECFGEPMQ